MIRDEREGYGEEARDVIEGLRRLAQHVETPEDLRAEILARGERLLPPQRQCRARWWTVVGAWRPHPLAWGPVVAAAFFVAGILSPWPRAGMPLKDTVSEERPAPVATLLSKEPTEVTPASPDTPSQPPRWERQQQSEPAPAPQESLGAPARRASPRLASSSQMQVTATLPAELYEQLQHEARRRQVSAAVLLREAVETYVQSHTRKD
jgi:Ribbon-helix-helix protein, copG family